MTPYELRKRLMEDVPEVEIYPILINYDYTEEEYQEELRKQLIVKEDIEKNRYKTVPAWSYEEIQAGLDKEYEKGNYTPKKFVTLPASIIGKGKNLE